MRTTALFFLVIPSFVAAASTAAHATEASVLDEQYRKLVVQIQCTRQCDQTWLTQRSEGMATRKADRQQSTCKMECSERFNRTSSIKSLTDKTLFTNEKGRVAPAFHE